MCAGEPHGFPRSEETAKPVCLYHYKKETILERQIHILNELCVKEITVVGGWKFNILKQFIDDGKFDLKLVYNRVIGPDGWLDSIKVGLQELDNSDDILIILGDVLLTKEIVKITKEHIGCVIVDSNGYGYAMYKISKEYIQELKDFESEDGIFIGLNNFCIDRNGVIIKSEVPLPNIDYLWTEEYRKKIRVVLMNAGKVWANDFPEDSKPKCLYHHKGETILEMQTRILRKLDIDDIIVVGWWKIEMLEQLNEEKKLGLKIVNNPSAEFDFWKDGGWRLGLTTVKVGLQGFDDGDVLLIFGDTLLVEEGVKKIIEHQSRCISVASFHGYQMYKIPKELIQKLKEFNDVETGAMYALHNFCIQNGGIKLELQGSYKIYDIDNYCQTDEGGGQVDV